MAETDRDMQHRHRALVSIETDSGENAHKITETGIETEDM
jgi:hypothetical protein